MQYIFFILKVGGNIIIVIENYEFLQILRQVRKTLLESDFKCRHFCLGKIDWKLWFRFFIIFTAYKK